VVFSSMTEGGEVKDMKGREKRRNEEDRLDWQE
jgi:hypothetical protein